mmetsp:Transcript_68345/g.172887  ORF Transcript_68345/g.172887 Transcript_68345/m.172887 type:complete len:291 (+) Transcript_68345:463-1335(+)
MGHHVDLAPVLHDLVQLLQDVPYVAPPAAQKNFLLLLRHGILLWRLPHVVAVELLRPVGVVVLRDDNDLVALLNLGVPTGFQDDLSVRHLQAYGHGVREEMHELPELLAHHFGPLLHVELVAVEAEERLVDFGEAWLPHRHQHQAADHVVGHQSLHDLAPHQLHQRLVVDVADLRHDVASQARVDAPQRQQRPQRVVVRLLWIARAGEDDDGPREVHAHPDKVAHHQRRPAAEDHASATPLFDRQLQIQLEFHLRLVPLRQDGHHPTAFAFICFADLLDDVGGLLGPPED